MLPEMGKTGTLIYMRKYLRKDCAMLQVWAGKTEDDADFLTFVCDKIEHYAVLQSEANSREYKVVICGDIMFMHRKNLQILAEISMRQEDLIQ